MVKHYPQYEALEQIFLQELNNKLTHHEFKKTYYQCEYYDFFNQDDSIRLELKSQQQEGTEHNEFMISLSKCALAELNTDIEPTATQGADVNTEDGRTRKHIFIWNFIDDVYFTEYKRGDFLKNRRGSWLGKTDILFFKKEDCLCGMDELIKYLDVDA